ncbi:DUF1345 domain-containing protein [Candidatus Filomicrobium marinum]|uniref:DUF1345 domain-containing protein n=1 Tax=Candidatus Filomicrobium marinum TaxID=1608628 RepID=UPI001FCD01B2|nr:DUF1345 domain-containing protein [Candidatus Filomicrobium marinum]
MAKLDWDFPMTIPHAMLILLIFSFVIGMTCKVADVATTNREIRRVVLIHGVISFFFNAILIALGVNIAGSFL